MPSRFPRIARTWQPEDSTVRSGCISTQDCTLEKSFVPVPLWSEVRNEVAGVAIDRLGVDGLGVEPFSSAGDHRIAAARSAEGQALHTDAGRQESR